MARRILIAGNWKMHKTVAESLELASQVAEGLKSRKVEVLVAPTSLALAAVARALAGSRVWVGAQNLFWEDQGAYTGEISGPFIKAAGASHVIIGHSERRQYFGESEKTAGYRVAAALRAGLVPILCVGESLAERQQDQTEGVLESQLAGALAGYTSDGQAGLAGLGGLIVAYEPVWAIGTGVNASEEQANEAHAFIRSWLAYRFDKKVAKATQILYGGSVKPANAAGLLSQSEVDGALVGGASLNARDFLGIIEAV